MTTSLQPLMAESKKESLMQFKLTDEFKDQINKVSAYKGLAMSSYIRMCLRECVERDLEKMQKAGK